MAQVTARLSLMQERDQVSPPWSQNRSQPYVVTNGRKDTENWTSRFWSLLLSDGVGRLEKSPPASELRFLICYIRESNKRISSVPLSKEVVVYASTSQTSAECVRLPDSGLRGERR